MKINLHRLNRLLVSVILRISFRGFMDGRCTWCESIAPQRASMGVCVRYGIKLHIPVIFLAGNVDSPSTWTLQMASFHWPSLKSPAPCHWPPSVVVIYDGAFQATTRAKQSILLQRQFVKYYINDIPGESHRFLININQPILKYNPTAAWMHPRRMLPSAVYISFDFVIMIVL